MALANDTGVRVRFRTPATVNADRNLISTVLPQVPRPRIPDQTPARYFNQWWIAIAGGDRALYIDFHDDPGFAPRTGTEDLSADAEANWEVAIRHEPTGAVLGPAKFSEADKPPTEPDYRFLFSTREVTDFFAQVQTNDEVTLIVYDPRVARTIGTAFNTIPPGAGIEARVRPTNSAGNGVWSDYSPVAYTGGADQPLQIAIPAGTRQLGGHGNPPPLRPRWTTSYSITGPSAPSAPTPISVVASSYSSRSPDELQVELGSITAAGEFQSATGPLNYIGHLFKLSVHAHTPAYCKVVVRATSQDAAEAMIANAAMRVQVLANRTVSTLFLGLIDDARCGFGQDGDDKNLYRASISAVSLLKKAGQTKLLQAPNVVQQVSSELDLTIPDDAVVDTALTGGLFNGTSYDVKAAPIAHFRHRADTDGPALLADSRDWPNVDIRVQSPIDDPLSYIDIAREIGNGTGKGWQLATDGFLRPMLHDRHPARMLSPVSGHSGLMSRDVAPFELRRNFRLLSASDIGLAGYAEGGAAGRSVQREDDPDNPGETRIARDPDGEVIFDHDPGTVEVMGWKDISWRGGTARLWKLLVLDPGGYGAHYPLPPMVAPILARVSVRRVANVTNGNISRVVDVPDYILSNTGAVLRKPETVSEADSTRRTAQPRTGRRARTGTFDYPAARTWLTTPTHVIRLGLLNDYPLPTSEKTVGAAYRDSQSGRRFKVTIDVIDEIRAPQEVSWDSIIPIEIGRVVDVSGLPGSGRLRVTQMDASLLNEFPGDLRLNWKITASQASELEEALDGFEFWRAQSRRR